MTLSYTLHLKLAVPDFLSEPWHAEFAAAMDSIDRALYEGIIVQGTTLWTNSTAYVLGDMVINPDNGSIYVCAVNHTSSASPTTFTQELILHPTFWGPLSATQLASQAEAEAGVDNAKYMSPLRTRQAIIAQIGSSGTIIAFTSSATAPVTPHKGDFWYDLTTGILSAYIDDGNTLQWVAISAGGGTGLGVEPQGRLTLQTGVSVMVTNQTAKTTLFYTPHTGNQIPLWNGTGFASTAFTELSVATTDTAKNPAAIGVSKVNDWFVWNDAGVPRLSHSVDWTNDTTRAAALVRVGGIWVNATAITNGPAAGYGTYVGTTRSNASSQLDWQFGGKSAGGTAGFFGVWNTYNRVNVSSLTADNVDNWTYAVVAWRAANANNNLRCTFVRGLDEDAFEGIYQCSFTNAATVIGVVGIALDITNNYSGLPSGLSSALASFNLTGQGVYKGSPGIGVHFLQAVEYCNTANTVTFYGDGGAGGSLDAFTQSGLFFIGRM